KLRNIVTDWNQLQYSWDVEVFERMYRAVHNLAGTGATFGFGTLGSVAREIANSLKPVLEHRQPIESSQAQYLMPLVIELCRESHFEDLSFNPCQLLDILPSRPGED